MGRPNRICDMGSFPVLERDGSNIGQYLLSLRNASVDAFEGFLDALHAWCLMHTICKRMNLMRSSGQRLFGIDGGRAFPVPGRLLSTGPIGVISLFACMRHPTPPPPLIVEEIENGLDPRTMHLVVEELRAALNSKKTQ